MFDATGKLPDGVLLGNTYAWGNWDECLNTTAHYNKTNTLTGETTEHSFSGKYCMMFLFKTGETKTGHTHTARHSRVGRVGLAPICTVSAR